jgi:hypothetical protein
MNAFSKTDKLYTRTNLVDKFISFVKKSAVKGLTSHALLCFSSDDKEEEMVRVKQGKDNLKMILGGDY